MKAYVLRFFLAVGVFMLVMSGSAWTEAAPGSVAVDLTVEHWVGHDFIFLGLPADKQPEGYEIFPEDQADRGFSQDRSVRLSYAAHFANQVTVTKVIPTGDVLFDYLVYMTEKGTDMKLVGRTFQGQLEGLALVEDREKAHQEFVGKTIYVKRRTLESVNGFLSSNNKPLSITVPFGTSMTVTDVWDGIQSREPIWLVVTVNGQNAALPIAYSWTNQPVNTWTLGHPWQQAFFTEDPRILAGGNPDVWSTIEAGSVKEGMTKDQVLLSWGSPNRIDEDTAYASKSLWIYGNIQLQFTGNILTSITSIEDLPEVSTQQKQ